MKFTKINTENSDLKDQLEYLIKWEFYIIYNKHRKLLVYLLGWTLLLILLLALTSSDNFISLKAILLILTGTMWLFGLIILARIMIKWYKRIIWKRKQIKQAVMTNIDYQMAFDDEKIYFITDSQNSEIEWNYYKYYSLDKNSIFIVPPNNIYESLCCSQNELGTEEFENIKAIASKKLTLIRLKNGI